MRHYFGSLLATALLAGIAAPAYATPTKAEMPVREMTDAHGKAGLIEGVTLSSDLIAALPAAQPHAVAHPKPQPKAQPKPAKPAHPAVAAQPKPPSAPVHLRETEVLAVKDVPPAVDFVTVLPGERFPLRALSNAGVPIGAKWRATGGELAVGDHIAVWQAPLQQGVYRVSGAAVVRGKLIRRNLAMIVTVPTANVRDGKLNGYPIGTYPRGFGATTTQVANRGSRDTYVVPSGFVELTAANMNTPLSEHYKLGDFAGKDNWVGGKKYLFVEPRLVEKLERLIFTLRSEGYHASKLQLMSAYRSPFLNADIGNVTTLSRHTYGDAADMIVADFNGDGKADKADADILMAAVTKLDKTTHLTGGASLYRPNGAHGYFIHTDTRGTLVRW